MHHRQFQELPKQSIAMLLLAAKAEKLSSIAQGCGMAALAPALNCWTPNLSERTLD